MGKEMEKYHLALEKDVKVDPEHPTENQRVNSQKEISETAKNINERATTAVQRAKDIMADPPVPEEWKQQVQEAVKGAGNKTNAAVIASVASVLARQAAKKWYKPVPKDAREAYHED